MKTMKLLAAIIALLSWASGSAGAQAPLTLPNGANTSAAIDDPASVDMARANDVLRARKPVFIENRGQWDKRAKFLLRSPGLDLWITGNGVVYDMIRVEPVEKESDRNGPRLASTTRGDAPDKAQAPEVRVTRAPVFISFEGASSGTTAVGGGQLSGYHNYLIGNDPSKWAERVPLYSDARVQGLYKGIDAVFYLDEGRPRYDLVVAPGADPSRISMKVEGATGVSVTSSGALRIGTTLGTIEQRELFAYQQIDGEKRQVRCAFVAGAGGRVRFDLGRYDRSRPLVIDPLVYSTYLGGSGDDWGRCIAVDGSGNAYVTGYTYSTNFPTLNASQTSNAGYYDAFVTKLTSSGAHSYSTYLGGSDFDIGLGIAVDGSGNAYVTGYSFSRNFPTLNASQTSYAGEGDAFVTKLTSSGARSYSTYLGGSSDDIGLGIAVDGSGNAYVTGSTESSNFPTLNASQTSSAGFTDAFVTKLTSSGALSYSTYLGGSGGDFGGGIAVDGSGNAYVTGYTYSTNFPTLNESQTSNAGSRDAFVTKLTSSGARSYSTYLGGSDYDSGLGIAVDGSGNAYVTGYTYSTNFPTLNASQASFAGVYDAFVTKLTSSGARSYSTYLGGGTYDYGSSIAVDGSGNAYVTGHTLSTNFPTLNASQTSNAGDVDAFVTKMTSSGARSYSTYLGGSSTDYCYGIAVDGSGNAYVTGYTLSTNFPTLNASQTSNAGSWDAFVTKLSDPGAIGLTAPASGSTLCAGATQSVTWTSSGVTNVRIELSSDGGAAWEDIVASVQGSAGSYAWSIPASQDAGSDYRIRISDAGNSAVADAHDASFTIINAPPSIAAPAAVILAADPGSCTRAASGVALGTPDVSDFCTPTGSIVVTSDAPSSFPAGTTTVTWTATNAAGNQSSAIQLVTVTDSEAPTLTVTLSPTTLWPANNQMRTINVSISASDNCSGMTWVLTSVTGDDGTVPGDINAATGTAVTSFDVRAKRSGAGEGRTYTATFTATDASGNTTTESSTVFVPHNQRGKRVVDAPAGHGFASSSVPNPFATQTDIRFSLDIASRVTLRIIDLQGSEIARLLDMDLAAGEQVVRWTGENLRGARVASGTYIYLIEAEGRSESGRIVLVR